MKILNTAAGWLFILCLPVLFLSASIAICFNSSFIYTHGFSKYQVSAQTGLETQELEKAAKGLISYFNSGEEFISVTVEKGGKPFLLFNEREVIHLKDVKGLVRLDYTILCITLIYALVFTLLHLYLKKGKYRHRLPLKVLGGCALTLLLILIMGIGSALNFDQLFVQFHLLSFANDFWLLDPSTDYLVMLFPGGFWFDVTIYCILITMGWAVIIGGVTGSMYFYKKAKAVSDEWEKKKLL